MGADLGPPCARGARFYAPGVHQVANPGWDVLGLHGGRSGPELGLWRTVDATGSERKVGDAFAPASPSQRLIRQFCDPLAHRIEVFLLVPGGLFLVGQAASANLGHGGHCVQVGIPTFGMERPIHGLAESRELRNDLSAQPLLCGWGQLLGKGDGPFPGELAVFALGALLDVVPEQLPLGHPGRCALGKRDVAVGDAALSFVVEGDADAVIDQPRG